MFLPGCHCIFLAAAGYLYDPDGDEYYAMRGTLPVPLEVIRVSHRAIEWKFETLDQLRASGEFSGSFMFQPPCGKWNLCISLPPLFELLHISGYKSWASTWIASDWNHFEELSLECVGQDLLALCLVAPQTCTPIVANHRNTLCIFENKQGRKFDRSNDISCAQSSHIKFSFSLACGIVLVWSVSYVLSKETKVCHVGNLLHFHCRNMRTMMAYTSFCVFRVPLRTANDVFISNNLLLCRCRFVHHWVYS